MISVIVTLSPLNQYQLSNTSGRPTAPAGQDKEQTFDLDKYLVCDTELLDTPICCTNLDRAV